MATNKDEESANYSDTRLSQTTKCEPKLVTHSALDGGWGWCVVVAVFLSQVMICGISCTFGVTYIQLRKMFNSSATETALAGSIKVGLEYFVAPISTALSSRYSARKTALCGGLLFGGALIISGYVPNIYIFIITFGIISAFGSGLTYLPGIILMNEYFDKYRSIANGIGNAGSGAGIFIFPPLMQSLFDEYGFSGAFLLLGALILNNCVLAGFYRPLRLNRAARVTKEDPVESLPMLQSTESDSADKTLSSSNVDSNHQDATTPKKDGWSTSNNRIDSEQRKSWRILFGIHHLKNVQFILFCVSAALATQSYISVLQLIADYARDLNFKEQNAVFFVTLLGFTDSIGRVVVGFLFDIPKIRGIRKFLYAGLIVASGVAMLTIAFCSSLVSLIFINILVGFFSGAFCGLRPVGIVDYFGPDDLSSQYGLLMAFIGLATTFGPMIPGVIKDATSKYNWSFVFDGLCGLLGGVILLGLGLSQRCGKKIA